jgi:predicted GNAT family acetyltransferase
MSDLTVTHSAPEERYVLTADGERAGYLDYLQEPDVRVITHTVVFEKFAGRGLAAVLTKAALDDTRAAGLQVRAVCSYVANYITKHPEYRDLVAVDARA